MHKLNFSIGSKCRIDIYAVFFFQVVKLVMHCKKDCNRYTKLLEEKCQKKSCFSFSQPECFFGNTTKTAYTNWIRFKNNQATITLFPIYNHWMYEKNIVREKELNFGIFTWYFFRCMVWNIISSFGALIRISNELKITNFTVHPFMYT